MARAAVFLDRDDTLIVNVPYLGDPEGVVLLNGVREGLWRLKGAGLALVVITNQSGVGRGLISVEQVEAVNRRVMELVGEGVIERVYSCYGTPEWDPEGCRKPSPRLVWQAARELDLDLGRSFFIGDRRSDMLCARNAGVKGVLVLTGRHDPAEVERAKGEADWVARDFAEAVGWVMVRLKEAMDGRI
ncbi:MAG: HAD family hydrolase [Methylacidiphilales bacterium]|nr:HAD family hydrolase [Candidatus Methylacidiphilales bacterium]MDW8349953.1 HAD family hydrolase [Verrucomicrobiae bacterium]